MGGPKNKKPRFLQIIAKHQVFVSHEIYTRLKPKGVLAKRSKSEPKTFRDLIFEILEGLGEDPKFRRFLGR